MREAHVLRVPPGSVQLCWGMSMSGEQGRGSLDLFHEIERDFEALVRLIERAIEQRMVEGASNVEIERLTRAKSAAQQGAALAKKNSAPRET